MFSVNLSGVSSSYDNRGSRERGSSLVPAIQEIPLSNEQPNQNFGNSNRKHMWVGEIVFFFILSEEYRNIRLLNYEDWFKGIHLIKISSIFHQSDDSEFFESADKAAV